MDSSNDLKNQTPEEIRGQIDQTRDALGDKLEELREKLSLSHRVQQHPWPAFFGAVGVGLVAGHMLAAPSRPEPMKTSEGPGLLALGGLFDQEIKSALTSALQAIWGEARHSVPSTIAGPVDRLLDRMSVRQGGFGHLGSLLG